MAPKNSSPASAAGTARLSQGNVTNAASSNPVSGAATSPSLNVGSFSSAIAAVQQMSNIKAKNIAMYKTFVKAVVESMELISNAKLPNEQAIKAVNASVTGSTEALKIISELKASSIKRVPKVMDAIVDMIERFNKLKVSSDVDKEMARLYRATESSRKIFVSLSKMAPLAPIATAGALLSIPAVTAFDLLMKVMTAFKFDKKDLEKINGFTKSANDMVKFMLGATAVVAACILMAVLVKSVGPNILLYGLAVLGGVLLAMSAIVFIVGGISKLLKNFGMLQAVNDIVKIILAMTLVVAVCIGLGALILQGDTAKIMLVGLAVLGMVILAVGLLALVVGFVGKLVGGNAVQTSMKNIFGFILAGVLLVSFCVAIGYLISNDSFKTALLNGALVMLGVFAGIILLAGVAWVAGKIAGSNQVRQALINIFVLAFASVALIVAAKYLGDFVQENSEQILIGLALTGGVMVALVGVGWLAGKLLNNAKRGIIALGVMELLAGAAIGVVYLAAKVADECKGKWTDIIYVATAAAAIVTGFGILAGIAGSFIAVLALGSLAIGMIELIAAGAILVVRLAAKVADECKGKWKDIVYVATGAGLLVAEFGILGGIAGLALLPVTLGLAAMAMIKSIANKSFDVLRATISVAKFKKESGVKDQELVNVVKSVEKIADAMTDLPGLGFVAGQAAVPKAMRMAANIATSLKGVITALADAQMTMDKAGGANKMNSVVPTIKGIIEKFDKKYLDIPIDKDEAWEIMMKYTYVDNLIHKFVHTAGELVKLAKIGDIIKGKNLVQATVNEKTGDVQQGKEVDIIKVGSTISTAIVTFTKILTEGFEKVSVWQIMKAAFITSVLSGMIKPVTKFTEMLLGFQEGEKANTVRRIWMDKDGKIQKGEEVNVVEVAAQISTAMITFTTKIIDTFKDISMWDAFKSGFMMKMVGTMIGPVSSFANALMGFQEGANGTIHSVRVTDDGKIVKGPDIDVAVVSGRIADAVSTFVSVLYSEDNFSKWSKLIYGDPNGWRAFLGVKTSGARAAEQVFNVFGQIIEPVKAFAEMVSMFSTNDAGKLCIVTVGDDGKIKSTREVDILKISSTISSAITGFITNLYSIVETDVWKRLLRGSLDEGIDKLQTSVDMFINVAEKMSSEKIKSGVIEGNCSALVKLVQTYVEIENYRSTNTVFAAGRFNVIEELFRSAQRFENLNATKIKQNTAVLKGSITDVVMKTIKTATPEVTKFKDATIKAAGSVKSFDKVLIDGQKKREESMKKLINNLRELFTEFTNSRDSIESMNSLFRSFERVNGNNIGNAVNAIRNGGSGAGGGSNTGNAVPTNITADVDVNALAQAIAEAMKNLTIKNNSQAGISYSNPIEALAAAINNLKLDID